MIATGGSMVLSDNAMRVFERLNVRFFRIPLEELKKRLRISKLGALP